MSTTLAAEATAPPAASGQAPAVVYRDAGKRFGDDWVVRGLDLALAPGTILGLIGPSGSGKTTVVRLTNGVYQPDEGSVEVLGKSPTDFSARERTAIGYLPQTPVLFDTLSLWENLNFHASLNGVRFRRRSRLRELLELVDLTGHEKKLVAEASGGMKRRLALAATLVHDPQLLMLDEPTAGIDPILRRRFWQHFRELKDRGQTLIITTQYVGEAEDCDVVGLLANGSIAAFGTPDELRRQAFGGEIIELAFDAPVDDALIEDLSQVEGVHSVETVDLRRLRMIVSDGGSIMPLATQRAQRAGHDVVDSEEVVPPFDDVFIELVGQSFADDTTSSTTTSTTTSTDNSATSANAEAS